MLGPDERLTLFDALRPPAGFELDTALATTFSLDLDFLAATLVALSGFGEPRDVDEDGDGSLEPVDVIEAVRRTASRMTVLTQAGQITVRRGRLLHAWLEEAVATVVVPAPQRVFHPKMWFLRYRREDQRVLRLLCASRNLTFDVSWDTMVQLDGSITDEPTHPGLGEFIRRALPLAQAAPAAPRAAAILSLADDFSRADFELPEHAMGLTFHPLGVGLDGDDPIGATHRRALVISPFLSASRLESIGATGGRHVLVARDSAIRQMGAVATQHYETYTLDPDADLPGTETASHTESDAGPPDQHLSGLHAKVFILEGSDRRTRLLTGSTNATNAAFGGNVEFLTELTFPRSALSIDGVLDGEDGVSLRSLLQPVTPPTEAEDRTAAEQLSDELDDLRRTIAERLVVGTLTADGDDFVLRIRVDLTGLQEPTEDTTASCWPTTLTEAASARRLNVGTSTETEHVVSFAGITRFLAVKVAATRDGVSAATSFVVPVQLSGLPTNRSERLLAELLKDPDRFTRYLLMLLSGPDALMTGLDALRNRTGGSDVHIDTRLPPIFEALMRAVSRHPERLTEIGRIANELERAGSGVLPEGWGDIWPPIHHAAGGRP